MTSLTNTEWWTSLFRSEILTRIYVTRNCRLDLTFENEISTESMYQCYTSKLNHFQMNKCLSNVNQETVERHPRIIFPKVRKIFLFCLPLPNNAMESTVRSSHRQNFIWQGLNDFLTLTNCDCFIRKIHKHLGKNVFMVRDSYLFEVYQTVSLISSSENFSLYMHKKCIWSCQFCLLLQFDSCY